MAWKLSTSAKNLHTHYQPGIPVCPPPKHFPTSLEGSTKKSGQDTGTERFTFLAKMESLGSPHCTPSTKGATSVGTVGYLTYPTTKGSNVSCSQTAEKASWHRRDHSTTIYRSLIRRDLGSLEILTKMMFSDRVAPVTKAACTATKSAYCNRVPSPLADTTGHCTRTA